MSEVDDLVAENNRDELNALAEEAGVENPAALASKTEVAQAIVDAQSEANAEPAGSTGTIADQAGVPGAIFEDESIEDVRERQFESTFGHLEGDDAELARHVAESQWAQEDAWNERTATGVVEGNPPVEEEE